MQRPADAGPSQRVHRGVLKRALGNAGLLLGGKGASGVMQLLTFAIAARLLGLRDFGLFSVMLAQIQLLIGLATFQSNQAIVRYGVIHLNAGDRRGFQALVKFGTMLDLLAGAAAGLIAFVAAPLVAEAADWDRQFVAPAQMLALLPLANAIATPKGVLRLLGRFDLLAHQVVLTPLARLLGTAAIAIFGGGLFALAAVWLVAGLAGAAAAVFLAWREARRKELLAGLDLSMRGATTSNPGIWRFSIVSNLHSSMLLLPPQIATIATGIALGATAAGLVRVAQEIGTALAKPIDLLNQTVYPDIARLAEAGSWRRLRKLLVRSGVSATLIGLLSVLILAIAGRQVISIVFGSEFAGAFAVLLLISAATTLTVSVFAINPALYAIGRPSLPMWTALIALLIFVAALFASLEWAGLLAAGLAYLAAGLATVAASLFWLSAAVPRRQPG